MFPKLNEIIKKYNLYFQGVINMYWRQAMGKLETVLGVFWGYFFGEGSRGGSLAIEEHI